MKNISHVKNNMVSIITVNFNQAIVTEKLIESLRDCTYNYFEIIVVDNASVEDCSYLKTKYPEIKLIKSDRNLGFAGGNNLGLNYAKGNFLLFINNDVEVHPNFLEPLIHQLSLDEKAIAVSPKINYFYQQDTIQYAGAQAVNPYTLKNKHRGTGEKDLGQYNKTEVTDYAHGACMLVPRSTIAKIGLMHEEYFLYYEEQDWCQRMNQSGGNIYYVYDSIVYHKESISTGKNSPLKTYYLNRNRILFARKNFKGLPFFVSMVYFIGVSIPKNTFSNIKSKAHLKAFYKGLIWNLTHNTTYNY
ncbi:MAG: glycosyltransferase family 2 protein [Flavobacteriia bacterium]|jgi:GT2 family glycosyltransferase